METSHANRSQWRIKLTSDIFEGMTSMIEMWGLENHKQIKHFANLHNQPTRKSRSKEPGDKLLVARLPGVGRSRPL